MEKFRLDNRVTVITGGAGLLGIQHAEAIAEAGGTPVLWDIDVTTAEGHVAEISKQWKVPCRAKKVDITSGEAIKDGLSKTLSDFGRVDILINNAANDPKVDNTSEHEWSRFENFSIEMWHKDISIGLTGAFLCSQIVGTHMAKSGGGVILNIASDLSIIAPDQRIYQKEGLSEDRQPVKPVTYSVVKHGLIGLTRYLATYWAKAGVRVNAISPGGVYTNQPEDFVARLANLIPMGRMAKKDEYRAAIIFLVSDASSYMTGANLVIDGGRTCW
jgi:NAD(P)-dependent dehydrogenase (short-subunit alcohol dehydrogenase family)